MHKKNSYNIEGNTELKYMFPITQHTWHQEMT